MIHVLVVDVIERVDPHLVIEGYEVNELTGYDVHGMDFILDTLRSHEEKFLVCSTIGQQGLLAFVVAGHKSPHSLGRFNGARKGEV